MAGEEVSWQTGKVAGFALKSTEGSQANQNEKDKVVVNPEPARQVKTGQVKNLLRNAGQLVKDLAGLSLVLKPAQALRYHRLSLKNFAGVLRSRSLAVVDRAAGPGPYFLKNNGVSLQLEGNQVLGIIREIWVRKVYLANGFLEIKPGGLVVDLGANAGGFSLFAATYLTHGKIVAVEAQGNLVELLEKNVRANRLEERVVPLHGIVGSETGVITTMRRNSDVSSDCFSVGDILAASGYDRIDFLKIDIEGSEFSLFEGDPDFLNYTGQLAIEIHFDYGDLKDIRTKLENKGFECRLSKLNSPNMCLLYARKRPGAGEATGR
ncbi:MAG: hypothetical protein JWP00_1740 [Chloroflexi bacterium]|jgi:FkbM family methyltransferase|nr:hypothetical protein [Chloroflexota bacterium]